MTWHTHKSKGSKKARKSVGAHGTSKGHRTAASVGSRTRRHTAKFPKPSGAKSHKAIKGHKGGKPKRIKTSKGKKGSGGSDSSGQSGDLLDANLEAIDL